MFVVVFFLGQARCRSLWLRPHAGRRLETGEDASDKGLDRATRQGPHVVFAYNDLIKRRSVGSEGILGKGPKLTRAARGEKS